MREESQKSMARLSCPVLNVSHHVPIATPTTDNVNHPRHTYFIKELAEVKVNVTLRLIKEGSEY